MKSKIPTLILAAGNSERMGRPKQLLAWGEVTVIEHIVGQLLSVDTDPVYVVLGANHKAILNKLQHLNCSCVVNPNWQEGFASSLKFGVQEIIKTGHDSVLVTLADTPTLPTSHFKTLKTGFRQANMAIVNSGFSNCTGVPTIFNESVFKEILTLKGDSGAGALIAQYMHKTIPFGYPFEDIDTPEAYRELLKKIDT